MRGIPSEAILDNLEQQYIADPGTALLRMGLISSLPCFLGERAGDMNIVRTYTQDTPYFEFQMMLRKNPKLHLSN